METKISQRVRIAAQVLFGNRNVALFQRKWAVYAKGGNKIVGHRFTLNLTGKNAQNNPECLKQIENAIWENLRHFGIGNSDMGLKILVCGRISKNDFEERFDNMVTLAWRGILWDLIAHGKAREFTMEEGN